MNVSTLPVSTHYTCLEFGRCNVPSVEHMVVAKECSEEPLEVLQADVFADTGGEGTWKQVGTCQEH